MANSTVYPYGPGGSIPSGIGVVNDLTTGGISDALSAEQGKVIGGVGDNLFALDRITINSSSTSNTIAISNGAIVITKGADGYVFIGELGGETGARYRISFDIAFSSATTATTYVQFAKKLDTTTAAGGSVSFASGVTSGSADKTTEYNGIKCLRIRTNTVANGATITITNLKAVRVDGGDPMESLAQLTERAQIDDSRKYGPELSSNITWETNATTQGEFSGTSTNIMIRKYASASGKQVGFKTDFLTPGRRYRMMAKYKLASSSKTPFLSYHALGGQYYTPSYWMDADSVGVVDWEFTYSPIKSTYIAIALNEMSSYGTLRLYDISIREILEHENESGVTKYEYLGERIVPVHHIWYNKEIVLSETTTPNSSTGRQGTASYGDYMFWGRTNNPYIEVFNLKTREYEASIVPDDSGISTTHCNAMSFGPFKYNDADDFPVLYLSSGYRANGYSYIYGYRIQRTEADSVVSWSATLVQTIQLPVASFGDVWTDLAFDTKYEYGWIIAKESYSNYRFYQYNIPSLSESTVTLTPEDAIRSSDIDVRTPVGSTGQGMILLCGKIYMLSGMNNTTDRTYIKVINPLSGTMEAAVPLLDIGITEEPEGFVYYDGNLLLCTPTVIYRLFFD